MKKLIIAFGFLGGLASPGLVLAQGVGTCIASSPLHVQYSQSQVTNLLSGSLACFPATTGLATYSNQEAHYANGTLGDYKRGVGNARDPSLTNIGSWSVDGTGKISYIYLPSTSASFSYIIFGVNGTNPGGTTGTISVDFCTGVGATAIRIRVVKPSIGPC